MRNLKRALSLALASVMLLGTMVVGTSASYTDVSSKNNQEAIEVLQAVGVMVGDEKGNFNPDQKVTRNEMAVIMANMLDLKVDDFSAASIKFTDVPAWAAKYVAACKADGIIAGYSETVFGGSDTVTAAQAALMMQKALGYFQFQADFGDDWQLATVKQASKIDLFDGINAGAGTALTRNDVAQLALNALEATMVEPDGNGGTTIKGDGFEITTGTAKYEECTTSKYDYNGSKEDTLQLCEKLFGKDLTKKTDKDDFCRPATVWTYVDGKDKTTVTAAEKPIEVYASSDFDKDELKDLQEDYTGKVTVYYNGGTDENVTKTITTERKGMTVEVYEDPADDNNLIIVAIEGYAAQIDDIATDDDDEVTTVTFTVYEAGYAISNQGKTVTITVDAEDNEDAYDLIKGYDEDDVFVAFLKPGWDAKDANPDKILLGVDDVETVEGEVTAKSADATYNGWVKIDGEKYTFANEYSQVAVAKKSDGVFYLYNGYILHFDGEANKAEDEYLYVVRTYAEKDKWDENVKTYYAEVVFADGTCEVVELDAKEAPAKGVYSYEYDKDDDNYTLKAVDTTAEKVDIEKGKTAVATNVTANSKTVYVSVKLDGTKFDDATVYTGYKNVKSMSSDTAYIVKDGKVAEYVFIVDATASVDDSDVIYISGASVSDNVIEDDDLDCNYYTYNAIVDGKAIEIMVDAKLGNKLDGVYNVTTTNDDGIYTKVEYKADEDITKTASGVKFEKAADEVITIAGAALSYTDDVKVFVADEDGEFTTGSINRNYSDVTITYIVNGDGEVTCIYIQK